LKASIETKEGKEMPLVLSAPEVIRLFSGHY
jgi:hypothetical protein